jgi:hypothetical protein
MLEGEGAAPVLQEPATGVTLSVSLTEGRSLVLQTYLPRDATLHEHHDLLDKLGVAADRQNARYRLEGLRANLEVHKKTLDQLTSDYERIEGRAMEAWMQRGKKGSPVLSATEAAQKSNAEQNIKRYRVEIAKLEAEIAQCEAIVAKVD